jgi:hypothetical protein
MLIITNAFADNQTYIPEKAITERIIAPTKGDLSQKNWQLKAKLNSNFSFTNNKDYVGQTDGSIYQFNINTESAANWHYAQHELLNELHILYGLSKTPQLEDIFKSKDQIQFVSTYLYHLKTIDWIGPFVRFKFTSSLFKGYYVSSNDENLVLNYANGQVDNIGTLKANSRFKLVKAFEPMTIRGNLGFFANPYDSKKLKVELKFGSGFQQTITHDGFVLADDTDTPEIEFNQLEDHTEAGLELETNLSGIINENVKWSILSNFFFPLNDQDNLSDELDGIEKLNTNIEGKISSKLTRHFSMDYLLVIKRQPLILDEWQIQNGIVVNFHYDLL